jgi:hypothetical protein
VQPVVVDSIGSSVSRELDTELSTIRVGRVFPFRSYSFFEEMIVGADIETIHLDNVVVYTNSNEDK